MINLRISRMSRKRASRFFVSILILIIFSIKWNVAVIGVETRSPSIVNVSIDKITEKFICPSNHMNSTETFQSTTTTRIDESDNNNNTLRLVRKFSCSKSQILYQHISIKEFLQGLTLNGLELPSPSKVLPYGSYCISGVITPETVLTSNPENNNHIDNGTLIIIKLAICNGTQEETKNHSNNYMDSNTPVVSVRKCCPLSYLLAKTTEDGKENFQCIPEPNNREWQPAIFTATNDDFLQHKHLTGFPIRNLTYGFPHCHTFPRSLENSKDIWFKAIANGKVEIGLTFWFEPIWLPPQGNEFCLDEIADNSSNNNSTAASHEIDHRNQVLLFCSVDHLDDYLLHRRILGSMCLFAAAIMLTVLIIFASVWEMQNLAGWTQFNFFVALFLVNLTEGLRQLLNLNALEVQSTTSCVIIAGIAQYFYMTLISAWSVMSFDLFYMFWTIELNANNVAWKKRRWIVYLIFTYTLPMFIVGIAFYFAHEKAIQDATKLEGPYAHAYERCCSPIRGLGFQIQGVMFLLNLIFFFVTSFLIWKYRRGPNTSRHASRNVRRAWRSVLLVLKLIVVMGVASTSIPIDYFFFSQTPLTTMAVCFRMIHFIPCVPALFIFGFNEKHANLISKKYPKIGIYFGYLACKSKQTKNDAVDLPQIVESNSK